VRAVIALRERPIIATLARSRSASVADRPVTTTGHHMNDDAGTTGRWMTYDELAEMRGIKRIGAVRLVQRYKWRRQAGNDGRARVLVPHDAVAPVRGTDAGSSAPTHVTPTSAGNDAGTDAGTMLAGALARLSQLDHDFGNFVPVGHR
jgi:hypothetical protein